MTQSSIGPLTLEVKSEQWPLVAPFRISGYTFELIDVLLVSLSREGHTGCGEAAGVYYLKDDAKSMSASLEQVRSRIEAGISRSELQQLLPPGGARNAVDCALWDLEAKLTQRPAWQIAELDSPKPLLTTFTCGADEPEKMAAKACTFTDARAIKIKLTGEPIDGARIQAVREARTDVWLGIDANQSFTRTSLEQLMPLLIETRVALIEQPFRRGEDQLLDGFQSPIPIAADESAQSLSDLQALVGRYSIVNIKLDKCGGLTEALAMARAAHRFGLRTMVGCMPGTSLGMAPACLVGQLCELVDLDAPIVLGRDRPIAVQYRDGYITSPDTLWGT
jgi:L-alanine-DL-glutamate epimerase-like enolase superfamily enzyme